MAGANQYAFPSQVGQWKPCTPTAPRRTPGAWWLSSATREPAVASLPATTSCSSPAAEMRRTKSSRQCCAGTLRLRSWQKSVSCLGGCLTTAALPSGSLTHPSARSCPGQFLCDKGARCLRGTDCTEGGFELGNTTTAPLGDIGICVQPLCFLCTLYP